MASLFKITVALSTITMEVPANQIPGLIRYQLIGDEGLIAQQIIPQHEVVFDDVPAGYYTVLAQRIDTDGQPMGNTHSKNVRLDEESENAYEAIASIDVAAYRQL